MKSHSLGVCCFPNGHKERKHIKSFVSSSAWGPLIASAKSTGIVGQRCTESIYIYTYPKQL